jgi:RNA polymerase sigma-70 factor (ECF subfamily)
MVDMWPDSDKTKELLDGARNGDMSAINGLLDRHRDALRRLVQLRLDRKIQQRVDVSDVVQDVLVEANRRLKTYLENPQLAFHLWLRHIAKDRIIDAHRRHRGSQKRSVDLEQPIAIPTGMDRSTLELMAQIQAPGLSPAAQVAQREMVEVVERAVSELREQDGEIIAMRHYERLSNQEVADALGLSEQAASMRYLRAVRKLRTTLDGNES